MTLLLAPTMAADANDLTVTRSTFKTTLRQAPLGKAEHITPRVLD